jgi:carbon-monoxide dehydrogenase medium subunit/xanthine dehydrogenase FAD-binding subunit
LRRLRFHRVATLAEALALKADLGADALLIAGGTDLLVALRAASPALAPRPIIDLSHLPELGGIRITGSQADGSVDDADGDNPGTPRRIRVGAAVTHTEIEQSELLQDCAPLLPAAAAQIGSPQTRNRGTIGGNVCNASPCADTVPPLLALGAELVLSSAAGQRRVPMDQAITAPYRTVLADDEILTDIRFAALGERARGVFVKLGRRRALSVSRMSMAVILARRDDGRLQDVRIAAGSVTPTAQRFSEVETMLEGQVATADLFAAAGAAIASEMIRVTGRRWSTPYKEPVVAALLTRALERVAEEWPQGAPEP